MVVHPALNAQGEDTIITVHRSYRLQLHFANTYCLATVFVFH